MKTFVGLWLLAVMILIGQSGVHGLITSKKLQSLPKFELMDSMNRFESKERSPSKVMSASDWQKQKAIKLDCWGPISWGIIDRSEPFSYARTLLERIIYGSPALVNSENEFIYHAIDLLEQGDLKIPQRIWILGVLRTLQDYSPGIKHPLLSSYIQEGPLCRAGLELSLTQSFDLFSQLQLAIENPNIDEAIDTSLFEGLQRVELLRRIKKWAQEDSQFKTSEGFKMIHDSLLQIDCPIKLDEAIPLANQCLTHIVKNPKSTKEARWTYGVLYHLYSICEELREAWKSSLESPQLQAIQQAMNNQMKYKEAIKDHMKRYFSNGNRDQFITRLLLPFTDILPVDLKHCMRIIDCFEAQEKNTHPSQSIEYWGNPSEKHIFTYHKALVMNVLRKASPYIQGAEQYLASRLKITDGQDKFSPLKGSNVATHNEEITDCSICLNEFVVGEHCIKLNCSHKHIFHRKCLMKWTNQSLRRHPLTDNSSLYPTCPMCRIPIKPNINPDQYILWWKDQSIHQKIPAIQPVVEDHMIREGSGMAQEAGTSKSG